MSVLICGSIAFDNIMVFQGRFREHILPEQIHILNVAFLVPEMRREFGGCAGNIAYNLKMLAARPDEEPLIMATVGQDSASYFERLKKLHLDATHVKLVPDSFTAQAFITTEDSCFVKVVRRFGSTSPLSRPFSAVVFQISFGFQNWRNTYRHSMQDMAAPTSTSIGP